MKDLSETNLPTKAEYATEQMSVCDACGSVQPSSHMAWSFETMGDLQIEICEDCLIKQADDLCWSTKLEMVANHPIELAPTSEYMTIQEIRRAYRKELDHE